MGWVLGILVNCTFDLTCLALLKSWPLLVAVMDFAWGILLTASTAAAALFLTTALVKAGVMA